MYVQSAIGNITCSVLLAACLVGCGCVGRLAQIEGAEGAEGAEGGSSPRSRGLSEVSLISDGSLISSLAGLLNGFPAGPWRWEDEDRSSDEVMRWVTSDKLIKTASLGTQDPGGQLRGTIGGLYKEERLKQVQ